MLTRDRNFSQKDAEAAVNTFGNIWRQQAVYRVETIISFDHGHIKPKDKMLEQLIGQYTFSEADATYAVNKVLG